MEKQKIEWPKIFSIGTEGREKAKLCADGLLAWGHCSAGHVPPENFGEIMMEISTRLNVPATAEGLAQWARQHGHCS